MNIAPDLFSSISLEQHDTTSLEKLLKNYDAGHIQLVTVNNRLAFNLKKILIKHYVSKSGVARIPMLQPWNRWLRQLQEQSFFQNPELADTLYLSPLASLLYWEATLQGMNVDSLNIKQLAKSMADAHKLAYEWQVEPNEAEITPEYSEFSNVRDNYLSKLKDNRATDEVGQMRSLLQALSAKDFKALPEVLVLVGFNEFSPWQQQLFNVLCQRGVKLCQLALDKVTASTVEIVEAQDPQHELKAAIAWAKEKMLESPNAKVAIVDPNLNENVVRTQRYLHQGLSEEGRLLFAYHVSLGRSLNQWPIINGVLVVLNWLMQLHQQGKCSVQEFGQTLLQGQESLLAPYAQAVTKLDVDIRKRDQVEYKRESVLENLEQVSTDLADKVRQCMQYLSEKFTQKQEINTWVKGWLEVLQVLNFPGIAKLDSFQYQTCRAFERALQTTAALHESAGKLNAQQAIMLLQRVCTMQSFQPQRDKNARLDVLGLLEAKGGRWDAVWVIGMQDDVLPAVPNPNPFLPQSALRRVQAPHAYPEWEYQWAQRMLSELKHTATELVFSYHQFEAETECMMSPLLATEKKPEPIPSVSVASGTSLNEIMESIYDNQGPAKIGTIEGGYKALELQSANPLWAFAVYRLGLQALQPYPRYAWNFAVRGNNIHAALEKIWKHLQSQENLTRLSDVELRKLVKSEVRQVAGKELEHLPIELQELEIDYAIEQIMRFMACEKQRQPFKVEALEYKVEINLAGLSFITRVDRIDRVFANEQSSDDKDANNEDTIYYLDYKTGNVPNVNYDWITRAIHPKNIQLPLYASWIYNLKPVASHPAADLSANLSLQQSSHLSVHAPDLSTQVGGLIFASLKADNTKDVGFAGLSSGMFWQSTVTKNSQLIVTSQSELQDYLHRWCDYFNLIAKDLAEGKAENVFESRMDLNYCDILPFLRLGQEQLELVTAMEQGEQQ